MLQANRFSILIVCPPLGVFVIFFHFIRDEMMIDCKAFVCKHSSSHIESPNV